jgi:nitrite reductase/ring-hydroxylating ferredoxin subunit
MSSKLSRGKTVSLAELPSCSGNPSRRDFCTGAAAGLGLLVLGLPGCTDVAGRISTGVLEPDGGSSGTGPDGSSGEGGKPPPDAGHPPHDSGGGPSPDLAQASGCGTGALNAGAASAIVAGTATYFSGSGSELFVCRDSGGVYALSARCTHAGARLQQSGSQLYCPRHGATFDLNGQQPTSPAFSPLDHYAVCIDGGGNVMVDPNMIVTANTRA